MIRTTLDVKARLEDELALQGVPGRRGDAPVALQGDTSLGSLGAKAVQGQGLLQELQVGKAAVFLVGHHRLPHHGRRPRLRHRSRPEESKPEPRRL